MTPKQIKSLLKLLAAFRALPERNEVGDQEQRDHRINSILAQVEQWIKWYGRDELNMDL